MPKCKYCKENITKFDKEICPFCGGKRPLDGVQSETCDITQCIVTVEESKKKHFKEHKKGINALLCMFLGIFGADGYYLGFKKEATIRLISNLVLYSAVSLTLFFFTELGALVSFIAPFVALFAIYFILGFVLLFKKGSKDSNGVLIR